MEVNELVHKVLNPRGEDLGVLHREGRHGNNRHLGRVPIVNSRNDVLDVNLLFRQAHVGSSRHDGLEELNIVRLLVLVLVLVPPKRDVHLALCAEVLGQNSQFVIV